MPFVIDDLLIGAAIMAAAAGAKHLAVDAPAARRKNKLLADTQRYSPWTGLKPDPMGIEQPNLGGALIGGAASGAAMGANYGAAKNAAKTADLQNEWLKTQTDFMKSGGMGFGPGTTLPAVQPSAGTPQYGFNKPGQTWWGLT